MTEIQDRLSRLADAAVGTVALDDPSTVSLDAPSRGGHGAGRGGRSPWAWLGAAAALVLVAAVAVFVVGRDDDPGGPVTAGPGGGDADPPVLAVDAGRLDDGAEVRVVGPEGQVGRPQTQADLTGSAELPGGLLFRLPAAGAYDVVLSVDGIEVGCPVEVAAGERLVLDMTGGRCGLLETVEQWAPEDTDVGQRYVGLPEDEAVARVEADGYAAVVVGRDGVAVLSSPEEGRVDLWVFDGVVVSAGGTGEVVVEPTAEVAVVLTSDVDGPAATGATVDAGRDFRIGQWATSGPGGAGVGLLFDEIRPGPATLELVDTGTVCTLGLDLPAGGTVVTITAVPDEPGPDASCPATVETLDEHVARVTEGWDAYDRADAYVGLTEAEAIERAEGEGVDVRALVRDGVPFGQTDDLRTDRVNLVLFGDEVRAAAVF